MFRKIGRVIWNNFGLKVLAAVLAIVLWLAIVNVADPNKSVTFTIPVEITNANYLADENKTYEILDNSSEITFTVEGPRSIVEELSESDFLATADLGQIDDAMMVPIYLRATSYNGQLEITSRQSYLTLLVEDLVTQEFDINVVTDGTPAEDCYVESAKTDPSVVTVTGPQSLVEMIASAQVSVSVDEAEENFTSAEPVLLLDENDKELDTGRLTMDVAEAEVSVQIDMTKTVPLRFVVIGEPAEGYRFSGPECDVDSVTIEGDISTIRKIDEIVIDSARLDVTDAEEDITLRLTLSNYLPAGVTLAEGESDSIEVTLPVEEANTAEETATANTAGETATANTTEETAAANTAQTAQAAAAD